MKIKKGDNVVVISGKDKGKEGKVTLALPRLSKVIVSGVNIKKINKRATKSGQKGQIIEQAAPIDVSNVKLSDSKAGKEKDNKNSSALKATKNKDTDREVSKKVGKDSK